MTVGLRIVPHAVTRPYRCAMWPQLGARHEKGYFDVGTDDPEGWNHSYVSVEFVEQAARHLGFASPSEVAELKRAVEDHERTIESLEADLREADRFAEAAEYTLNHFGSKVKQKPGRKAREVQEAA